MQQVDGTSHMIGDRKLLIAIVLLALLMATGATARQPVVIGESVTFESEILQKAIRLSIHVPVGSNTGYPVLFTFQTHFAQVTGAVSGLYDDSLIPEMIVVRIDNYEYGWLTPTEVTGRPGSGQAEHFADFFEHELIPFIDSEYRTQPYRLVFSSSWGAMFVTWAILNRPDVFNAGIASIPWIDYDRGERHILGNTERRLRSGEYDNFLYMSMGEDLADLPDFPRFIELFRTHPAPGLQWEYRHWPEEDHASTPYRTVYAALRSLYAEWNHVPHEIAAGGLAAIESREAELDARFGYPIGVSAVALGIAAQSLQRDSDFETAIEILEHAAKQDPENLFVRVSLGRTLDAAGQLERARDAFGEALRLARATSHQQVEWIEDLLGSIEARLESDEGPP